MVSLFLFLLAVTIHEVSHGWAALALGDPTARVLGRLTLNPFRHIDWMGTVFLPLLLVAVRSPVVFGWAKPVPVNAQNFRHPRRDMLWVGAAGPGANFLFAAALAFSLKVLSFLPLAFTEMVQNLILINLVLGTFNLLPIPPLDGSRVLTGILPPHLARLVLLLEPWGFFVVILLLSVGFIDRILWPIVLFFGKSLGVGFSCGVFV